MADRAFFSLQAKEQAAAAIRDVEAGTSVELVIAVRHRSGHYRDADYACGCALAMVSLLFLLFHPDEILVWRIPLYVLAAFVIGALICSQLAALRRGLTRASRRHESVRTAARAAFVEMGVSATRGRTGVLVFVSMLERTVEVVADIGIDPKLLGPPWDTALEALRISVASRPDYEKFLAAVRSLGAVFAKTLPRSQDDLNELPDTMDAPA